MITIAIPHYHRHDEDSKYLKQCLESVKMQSIYDECEIILCDDNSPRFDLLERVLKEVDIRIMVIRHRENKGVAEARNTIMDIAKGDFIYFLDSDDTFYHIDSLKFLRDSIGKNDVVVGNFFEETFDTNGKKIHLLRSNDKVCVHGKLYSLKFLKERGIRFPNLVRAHEDVNFNIQILYDDYTKSIFIDKPILLWRYKSTSITRNDDHRYSYDSHIDYMIQFIDAIKKTRMKNPIPLLVAFMFHTYVSAQESKFREKIEAHDKIREFTKEFIRLNQELFNIITYDTIVESFSNQLHYSVSRMSHMIFRDDPYTWFRNIGWNIEKNKVFELKLPKNY